MRCKWTGIVASSGGQQLCQRTRVCGCLRYFKTLFMTQCHCTHCIEDYLQNLKILIGSEWRKAVIVVVRELFFKLFLEPGCSVLHQLEPGHWRWTKTGKQSFSTIQDKMNNFFSVFLTWRKYLFRLKLERVTSLLQTLLWRGGCWLRWLWRRVFFFFFLPKMKNDT